MITIKCAKCRNKILKYLKIGEGKILRCYKDRIKKYYIDPKDDKLICNCGNIIGVDIGGYFKMSQSAFTYSGHIN
ncbi:MAG: hypothetical protein GF329_22210 [Candidatus Lokiarchaeota archaeon]|nr:hypothetical protein [Candidatus Lokiarchaeota archaeon]